MSLGTLVDVEVSRPSPRSSWDKMVWERAFHLGKAGLMPCPTFPHQPYGMALFAFQVSTA